ncbi:MAG TPA: hypothetical protein HPP87_13480, partial [Planctomycetes bacterium]|nr:hypothetical protein [Planctomycetota bacterium]
SADVTKAAIAITLPLRWIEYFLVIMIMAVAVIITGKVKTRYIKKSPRVARIGVSAIRIKSRKGCIFPTGICKPLFYYRNIQF